MGAGRGGGTDRDRTNRGGDLGAEGGGPNPCVCAAALVAGLALAPSAAAQGATSLISKSSSGALANGMSEQAVLTPDGRWISFVSAASSLVPGDTNGVPDIFVHDRQTGETTRVSVDSAGNQGNGQSGFENTAISADGRYVLFSSWSSNLVAGDTNNHNDLFLHDRTTGETKRISLDAQGQQVFGNTDDGVLSADVRFAAGDSDAVQLWSPDTNNEEDVYVFDLVTGRPTCVSVTPSGQTSNQESLKPAISADGRWVAFSSSGSDLVSGDTNGHWDIFLRDLRLARTWRVSVDSAGNQADGPSDFFDVSISADGRYVSFQSQASNLVTGDTNGVQDVFVHDHRTGKTVRVSVDSHGNQANGFCEFGYLSGDGRFVTFASDADNLVAGDTNGQRDIFLHDRTTGQTTLVSLDSAGRQSDGGSTRPRLTPDGRFVVFQSAAGNLDPADSNGVIDVFLRDREGCGAPWNYCISAINSTGQGASIGALGSTSITRNDLVLVVSGCPVGASGMFFFGSFATQIPFGEGYLCVTGNQQRLLPAVLTGPGGAASLALDFSDPTSSAALITPGSTWRFQLWYRDPQLVGQGFNLTNGLGISFCP